MEKISLDTNPNSNLFYEFHQSRTDSMLGLIQISHGMAEHKGRYREFINFLNLNGFHVVIHDHRGHGERILNNEIGFFDQENGWNLVVNDLLAIHLDTNKRFPNMPKILLGHSMGSWIGLSALQQKNIFDAAMLSGSSYPNSSETFIQKLLLKIEMLRFGKNGYSTLLHKIIFGGFNSKFKNTITPNDWLSQDVERVEDYSNDPLCGFVVTNQLWFDLIEGIKLVFDQKNLSFIKKNIPILVFSGSHDPVGAMGKGTRKLHQCLIENECKSELYLVDGARHETLNETNRIPTYNHILKFLISHIKGA